jgi:hypothetical protein
MEAPSATALFYIAVIITVLVLGSLYVFTDVFRLSTVPAPQHGGAVDTPGST